MVCDVGPSQRWTRPELSPPAEDGSGRPSARSLTSLGLQGRWTYAGLPSRGFRTSIRGENSILLVLALDVSPTQWSGGRFLFRGYGSLGFDYFFAFQVWVEVDGGSSGLGMVIGWRWWRLRWVDVLCLFSPGNPPCLPWFTNTTLAGPVHSIFPELFPILDL